MMPSAFTALTLASPGGCTRRLAAMHGGHVMDFRLLGPLEVRGHDGELCRIPSGGVHSLLVALLVHADTAVSTDKLADYIWGDALPRSPREALQVMVFRLRRCLGAQGGDRITTVPTGYRLEVLPGEVDLHRFADLHRRGTAALGRDDLPAASDLLGRALACWQGRPFQDTASGSLTRDLLPVWEELRLEALRGQVTADLALGRHHQLVPALSALVAAEPLREHFRYQLILALYRSGRRAQALDVYQDGRRVLVEQLGLEPGPELQNVLAAVLADDPALLRPVAASPSVAVAPTTGADPARPAQLRADLIDFTGHAQLVEELKSQLSQAAPQQAAAPVVLSAVIGFGGVGKTTLAVHVAHHVLPQFPDGQLQTDLHGAGLGPAADPHEVLAGFLRALGIASADIPTDPAERQALYRTVLAQRRVLILLDNARNAAQVRPLLPGAGRSMVLITSRSALPGLDGVLRFTLGTLTHNDARELFTRIVGVAAVDTEAEAVAAVLRACGGLPLAIRIAASRLACEPQLTAYALAEQLTDQAQRLDTLQVEDREVRGTLAVSLGALSPRDREAFVLMGLWTGADISTPAAAALFATQPGEAQQILDRLADAHLLECTSPSRYTSHDLVHLLAAELATQDLTPRHRQEAVRQLATWFLHAADRAVSISQLQAVPIDLSPRTSDAPLPVFQDSDRAKTWCEAELANLTSATLLAAEHGLDVVAWQLPKVLRPFYGLVTQWEPWETTHNAGLASARRLDDQLAEAHMTNGLGSLAWQKRNLSLALDLHTHALTLFRQAKDQQGELSTLNNLGIDYAVLEDFEHAKPIFEQCIDLARAIGDPFPIIVAVQNLAECDVKLGNHHEAARTYTQSLELARQHSIPTGEARALAALGEIYYQLNDLDAAERSLKASADLWREIKHPYRVADTLLKLGHVHCDADDHEAARRAWEEAHTGFAALQLPEAAEVQDLLRALP